MKHQRLTAFLFAALLFPAVPAPAQSTRFVTTDGDDQGGSNTCLDESAPCRTIEHALSAASTGDTIDIGVGNFTEGMLTIDKDLVLRGRGNGSTAIQAHPEPDMAGHRVIDIPENRTVSISRVTIRHGKALGGGTSGRGGGIRVLDSHLVLIGVTLEKNIATFGGAIHNSGATGSYTNVTFRNNRAFEPGTDPAPNRGNGGGIFNFRSSPTLQNVEFTGNVADLSGGAIRNQESSPLFQGVTFTDNSAERLGGAMYNLVDSAPQLNDVTITGNVAGERGGGIHNTNSSPGLENVVLEGNDANEGGGMSSVNASHPTLQNVTFDSNTASEDGGGMLVADGSSVIFEGGAFTDNSATAQGGGMAVVESSAALLSVTFASNSVTGPTSGACSPGLSGSCGGGLYSFGNDLLLLDDVTFTENQADRDGGGLYNHTSPVHLSGVTFSGNQANFSGGGLYAFASDPLSLEDVTFTENQAGQGGGLYNLAAPAHLTGATFSGNQAASGGGMSNVLSESILENVTFEHNLAQQGGGFFDQASSGMTSFGSLVNAVFSGNGAIVGGGIFSEGASTHLVNVTLSGNTASGVTDGQNTLGGGGILAFGGASLSLVNTILWGNRSLLEGGGDEICAPGSSAAFSYSLYADEDGDLGCVSIQGGGAFTFDHSFSEDPLLMNPQSGNHRLTEASPAIDAGDPGTDTGLFPVNSAGDPIDLDGNPRYFGGTIDIGAYEFRPRLNEIFDDRFEQE